MGCFRKCDMSPHSLPCASIPPLGQRPIRIFATAILAWTVPFVATAEDWFPDRFSMTPPPVASRNLLELSLEELATIKVTSVSKAPELLFAAPTAIAVLTAEEIHRSGAHRIPDALRLVPGVNVAQQDAHTFAISARGSSDAFANKLLVLMDGRSVYSPLFSGVLWDAQDTVAGERSRRTLSRRAQSARRPPPGIRALRPRDPAHRGRAQRLRAGGHSVLGFTGFRRGDR